MRRFRLRPLPPLLVLLLAGCGGGTTDAAAGRTHTIEIREMAFQPSEVRLHPGDTVVWVNRDVVPHNAADGDGEWASPALARDERWELVVGEPAVLDYVCDFHPTMEGRLVVEESPSPRRY